MPYYAKSEDWLHQSSLLLEARPSTVRPPSHLTLPPQHNPQTNRTQQTRITTRYHLKPARRTPKQKKPSDDQQPAPPTKALAKDEEDSKPPRGHLVLKTFDPASGVTLKYKTSKAAEVGRLVQMLGQLGRRMAGVAVSSVETAAAADEVMADVGAGAGEEGSGVATPVVVQKQEVVPQAGVGKGKKKKGKR